MEESMILLWYSTNTYSWWYFIIVFFFSVVLLLGARARVHVVVRLAVSDFQLCKTWLLKWICLRRYRLPHAELGIKRARRTRYCGRAAVSSTDVTHFVVRIVVILILMMVVRSVSVIERVSHAWDLFLAAYTRGGKTIRVNDVPHWRSLKAP